METIQCSKCGAVFEKTGAKDKLRRFKDKRFMTTFHCPNCDARVILKNGDEPISIYLKRLERLKEQARRLGDRQEVNELQDEIDQINREIKMDAGKTKDKKFSMKGNDAGYDPTTPKNIAKAKALSVAQGKAASDAKDDVNYLGEKVFHTYESWKVACKRVNPNVVFEGDRDICNAKPGIGEWDGVTGVIYKTDDEAYDPIDPENIAEEKELAKARGAAAADKKTKDAYRKYVTSHNGMAIDLITSIQGEQLIYKAIEAGGKRIEIPFKEGFEDTYEEIVAKYVPRIKKMIGDSKTKDSLFKGQKVTAIKSEQGLREGETYTILGEEAIIKQIVGENDATVYKLQDSSGNVIVIENSEGLFYEVKDSLIPVRQSMSSKEVEYKIGGQWKPIEGKVKAAYENDQIKYDRADGGYHYYTCEVKDSKTKDNYRSEQAYDEGYKAGREGKGINANPYSDVSKSGYADLHDSWQDGWKSGKLDSKATDSDSEENESLKVKIGDIKKNMDAARKMGYDTEPYQKEIDKLETKDDEELSGMLVNDAPDYYGAIVATARRGNNPRMGGAELRKNIEPFMTAHGVQFNEEEFNKAYKEFNHAGISKAAFMKGTDAKTKDALMECMECGHKFKKNLSPNTFEVKCPKCGGYDVDVISGDSKTKDDIVWEKPKDQLKKELEEAKKNKDYVKADEIEHRLNSFVSDPKYKDSSDFYTKDPLTKKGEKILAAMKKAYGEEKGEQIFYASKNKGTISGVDSGAGLQGACGGERKYDGKGPRFGQDEKTKDDYKVRECPNCKNPLTYAGEENGKTKYKCELCGKSFVSKDKKTKDKLRVLEFNSLSDWEAAVRKAGGRPERSSGNNTHFFAYLSGNRVLGEWNGTKGVINFEDSKTKDGSLDEMIRKMAREKADVPYNDDGTIRTPQQAQLAYEQWYKIIKSRYKNDSRWAAEYGDSKTKDDYKRIKLADLLKKAKEGYFELQSDPKPRNHVEIKYPDGKKEWVFVEDQEIKIIIGDDPVTPSPAEQKVEGNDVIYKEYTLKQLPETGEFEVYAPGGSIVGHAKALELAKLFVDRIVASRVGDEWSEEARKKL